MVVDDVVVGVEVVRVEEVREEEEEEAEPWEVGVEEVEGAVDDERMEVTAGSCRTERG
jgi:hypothetical protein